MKKKNKRHQIEFVLLLPIIILNTDSALNTTETQLNLLGLIIIVIIVPVIIKRLSTHMIACFRVKELPFYLHISARWRFTVF